MSRTKFSLMWGESRGAKALAGRERQKDSDRASDSEDPVKSSM